MTLKHCVSHAVAEGALYYASSKRRRIVKIDEHLRRQVMAIAAAVRDMLTRGVLPPPTTDTQRCKGCSLRDRCQPEAMGRLLDRGANSTLFDPDA